jgi:hypothetical protein
LLPRATFPIARPTHILQIPSFLPTQRSTQMHVSHREIDPEFRAKFQHGAVPQEVTEPSRFRRPRAFTLLFFCVCRTVSVTQFGICIRTFRAFSGMKH